MRFVKAQFGASLMKAFLQWGLSVVGPAPSLMA